MHLKIERNKDFFGCFADLRCFFVPKGVLLVIATLEGDWYVAI